MRIICIGRQFGSGGHEIALRVGQQLGIPVYEKNILHLACKYGGLAVKTLEDADENRGCRDKQFPVGRPYREGSAGPAGVGIGRHICVDG